MEDHRGRLAAELDERGQCSPYVHSSDIRCSYCVLQPVPDPIINHVLVKAVINGQASTIPTQTPYRETADRDGEPLDWEDFLAELDAVYDERYP